MTGKQSNYDALRHTLESGMIRASSLPTRPEQQGFVNRTFTSLHQASQEKRITHEEYVKLINRLAAYAGGAYNDYIDTLTGDAQLGMLDLIIQGELSQATPEASRQRSHAITEITGTPLAEPDQGDGQ